MADEVDVIDQEHTIAPEVVAEAAEVNAGSEDESAARAMGWLPKEEYRGDPDKWKPAKEFAEVGMTKLPVLVERLKTLSKENDQIKAGFKEIKDWRAKAEQEGYERALADVKAKQKEAAALGDTDAFDKAEEEREKLEAKRPVAQVEVPQNDVTPAISTWLQQNPWYGSKATPAQKQVMGGFMQEAQDAGLSIEEALAQSEEKFLTIYKDLAPRRAAPARIEGSRAPMSQNRNTQGWKDLDEETQQVGMRFIKAGVFKDKEDYAQTHFKMNKGK